MGLYLVFDGLTAPARADQPERGGALDRVRRFLVEAGLPDRAWEFVLGSIGFGLLAAWAVLGALGWPVLGLAAGVGVGLIPTLLVARLADRRQCRAPRRAARRADAAARCPARRAERPGWPRGAGSRRTGGAPARAEQNAAGRAPGRSDGFRRRGVCRPRAVIASAVGPGHRRAAAGRPPGRRPEPIVRRAGAGRAARGPGAGRGADLPLARRVGGAHPGRSTAGAADRRPLRLAGLLRGL